MKVIKRLIILIIIIILILIFALVILNEKDGSNNSSNTGVIKEDEDGDEIITETLQEVYTRDYYYIVKNIINNYMDYVIQYNSDTYYSRAEGEVEITEEDRQAYLDIIYNFYDKEYMEKNSINENNLIEEITQYKNVDDFEINKMYYQDIGNGATLYVSQIDLLNESKYTGTSTTIAMKIDNYNGTFAIIPGEAYKDVSIGESIQYSDMSIDKNLYNQYRYKKIDDLQVVEDLYKKYINVMLYNKEQAYDLFDEEYRNKRFGDYDTFSKYVDNNLKEIAETSFEQYLVNTYDGYKEYVCKDQYENLYIFNETAVMDVTMQLDTYTLENQKFTETYNSASQQMKVQMNVDKWMQMLNCRDYKSAFEVLDETFRTTYFQNNVDVFEQIMREKYPGHYEIEFTDYSEETGIPIITFMMTEISGKNTIQIEQNVYMQLKEGTDFVMSFNVK